MIGEKIQNRKKSSGKSQRVTQLTHYISNPELENGKEKCIHFEADNFITDEMDSQIQEMIALATAAVRSKDPIDHSVLSWQEGETPTIEQAREAVQMTMKHLGLEGHQVIWGLHADTDNAHIHIEVNRVNPETLKVIEVNKGFQKNAIQQAAALVEKKQGWKSHDNARFKTDELGHLIVDSKDRPKVFEKPDKNKNPSGHAQGMEIQTGQKSAQRIAIEDGSEIIIKATSWADLHEKLAKVGMEYRRNGSGAVIFVGDVGIKASDVNRKFSFGSLQKRFGLYQPANEKEIKNDPHNRTQLINNEYKSYFAKSGFGTGNNMRNLSGCNLAHSEKNRQGKTSYEGVLQLDVGTYRQRDSGMRRGSNSHRAEIGERRKSIIRPLADNQPGWNEYIAIRDAQKVAKTQETLALQKRHSDERTALYEKLKAERTQAMQGDWSGKGAAKNQKKSGLATLQAAEKLELSEKHRDERKALQARYKPLPMYKVWKEQPQIVGLQVLPALLQQNTRDKQISVAKTLRALTTKVDARQHTTYQLNHKDVFRDEGRTIAVLDLQSNAGIAAALAVAQQKFGNVLELTGSDEFKKNAVAVAVDNGLTCRFLDPELDKLREQLRQQKYQAERGATYAKVPPKPPAPVHLPIQQPGEAVAPRPQTLTTQQRFDQAKAEKQATRAAQREEETSRAMSLTTGQQSLSPEPLAQHPFALDEDAENFDHPELGADAHPPVDYLAEIHKQIEAAKAKADPRSSLANSTTTEADHDAPASGVIVASNDEFVAVQQRQSVKLYRVQELTKQLTYDGIDTGSGRFAVGNALERKNGKNGMRTLVSEEREDMQTEAKREQQSGKGLGL